MRTWNSGIRPSGSARRGLGEDRRAEGGRDLSLEARLSGEGGRLGGRGEGGGLRRDRDPRRVFARPHAPAPGDDRAGHPGDQARQGGGRRSATGPGCSARPKAIKGRRITGFYSIRDDVENAGAIWQDAACVRDGNIVTSRTPDDLPAFMIGIFEALAEPPVPRGSSSRALPINRPGRAALPSPRRRASRPACWPGRSGLEDRPGLVELAGLEVRLAELLVGGDGVVGVVGDQGQEPLRPSSTSPSRRHWTARP